MSLQDLIAAKPADPLCQRSQSGQHTALPVDQRSITIECQRLEFAQFHETSSFRPFPPKPLGRRQSYQHALKFRHQIPSLLRGALW